MPDPGPTPPPEHRFRRRLRPRDVLRQLWLSRQIVRTLAERQIRAQYKQAWFGIVWAIATPVVTMIVFTIFFKHVARINTGDIPYPLFAYTALVPWQFFASSLQAGGQALLTNKFLLNKLSCPRESYPLASLAVAGVNFLISLLALGAMFLVYAFPPAPSALLAVVPLMIQLAFTIGVVLVVAPLTVYVRDLVHALPLLIQVGLFATPIAYPLDSIPSRFHVFYAIVNPLAPVIEAYRALLLGRGAVPWSLLIPASVTATVVLLAGFALFKRMEPGLADIA